MGYRLCIHLLAMAVGAMLLFSPPSQAAEVGNTPSRNGQGNGDLPGTWGAQLSVSHLPAADVHSRAGDVTLTDYRLKVARNVELSDRMTLTVGGGYGLKQVDGSPSLSLPRELHGLFLEAGARYRFNDRAYAMVRAYPGFYGDFKEIGADSLRMPLLALGGYRFDNGVSMVGGFVYRFGYQAGQLIPVLGFSYQPDETWRIDLVAPRPGVTYRVSRQLQLFAAGDFSSDEYELTDRSFGATAIKYHDYKVMGGVQYQPASAVRVTTAVGYAFDRKFYFYNGNRSDFRVDDVPFLKISLEMGW